MFCAFRFRPALVVGIPVALAILRFALVIPTARFQLNPGIMLFLRLLAIVTSNRFSCLV